MRTVLNIFFCLVGLAGAPFASAWAQTYPVRPVSMVVAFPAGGGHDTMARLVAERLAKRLGQPVIVENRAGANGRIGAEYVARAAPDGHTILFASPAEVVIGPLAYREMRYDPASDLEPVTLAATTPLVIVAHPSAGVRTLEELIASARKDNRKWSYGSPGTGSSQHLAGEWIKSLARIDLSHVPYKGAGPATQEVLGGHIPLAIVGMAPVLPHIRQGKLVPLAVTTSTRVAWAKEIPAVSELPGLAGFEVSHWMGVLVPAGTPPAVVQRLQSEIAAVVKLPDVHERLTAAGIDPVGSTAAEYAAFLRAERERFAKIYSLSGLKPE